MPTKAEFVFVGCLVDAAAMSTLVVAFALLQMTVPGLVTGALWAAKMFYFYPHTLEATL